MELGGDSDDEKKDTFTINKNYAQKYNERHRLADIARANDLPSDSDSENEDEVGEDLDPVLDQTIMQTISKIRAKDSSIYSPDFKPFENIKIEPKEKEKKEKIMTYKDMVRIKTMKKMESENQATDSENEDDIVALPDQPLAYDDEQKELRKAFQEDEGDSDDENLFTVKPKKSAQNAVKPEAKKKKKPKVDYNNEAATDAFLNKYLQSEVWKQEDGLEDFEFDLEPTSDETERLAKIKAKLEEDLDFDEKAEGFEKKYNFRFEEEGASEIVSHPRVIPTSVRNESKKLARRRQREAKKKRHEEEKQRKIEELKRLKALKKQELIKRAKETMQVAGIDDEVAKDDLQQNLDDEFDPEKHEALMQKLYGADYYGKETEDNELEEVEDEVQPEEDIEALRAEIADEMVEEEEKDDKYWLNKVDPKELDNLDFEDITRGTKFKYKQVEKNSYGLSTTEILTADRAILNEFVSIKRMAPYIASEWRSSSKHRQKFRSQLKELGMTDNEKNQKLRERAFERVKKAKLEKGTFVEEIPKANLPIKSSPTQPESTQPEPDVPRKRKRKRKKPVSE